MSDTAETAPRRGARFSLLTLVWLITVAALAVGLYSSGKRNAMLEARNQELAAQNKTFRDELGIFEIEDLTKIHAIGVPSEFDEPLKYRVYLPPGRKYFACYQANRIPKREVPEPRHRSQLQPGSWLISVDLERDQDRQTGKPLPAATARLRCASTDDANSGLTTMVGISERENDWIVNQETGQMAYGWQDIGNKLELHEPTQPLVLYRARAQEIVVFSRDSNGRASSYSTKQIDGETDGFMLWIEPQEEEEE